MGMSQLKDLPQSAHPEAALAAMAAAVGAAHVLVDEDTRERYARSTAARPVRPLALVRPGDAGEVAQLVRIAAGARIAVYPISTGKNWGYGDACAVGAGQVILDLSRMNRIIHVDPELAYTVIEPGVTQRQLSDYLRQRGYRLWADCTGAGPDTSYIGNIMERGFGHSPYGNRLQHVAGMQVVLPGGELLETGFGHYAQSRTTHLFPYGVGPFLDGLFTQSNMGIVTRLGIWLMPQAECVNHFLCSVPAHADIGPVVDALRPLRLDGTLRSILHIGNDMRVLSGAGVFPRARVSEGARLPQALRSAMREQGGIGAWSVSGALYGTRAQVAAARAALRRALRGTAARPVFISERSLRAGALAARLLGNTNAGRRLRGKVALGESLFAMNRGVPDGRFLTGAYWRRRDGLPASFPAQADPARDGCGLLWVSPVLPLRGEDMLAVHALAEVSFERYGFDLFATFSMINERTLGGVLTIAYDKQDPDETARARACHDEVFGSMFEAGYIPYRVGNHAMARLDPARDTYWRTVGAIKAALDPAGILAPGRYQPDVARELG
ncbi:FAD-binding oxidoreductase [Massilia litorea]|uniref:FAD-binding oxidoreductase n=2 Tax=Massilia litorea TaxID=2769491 RepID=A0A7L9U1G8_9BURK|nr:FAD-binding oxidoreductase [Massilia litorea]